MPGPVPAGEAEHHAQFSYGTLFRLAAPVTAHGGLLVVLTRCEATSGLSSLEAHTRFVAAVLAAHSALGVYDGEAKATHATSFYSKASVLNEKPMNLWTGLSFARESEGRMSVLSRGLRRFAVPEILMGMPVSDVAAGTDVFLDVATYIVRKGGRLPPGDTIGRTDREKLRVAYGLSPFGGSEEVMRVELP